MEEYLRLILKKEKYIRRLEEQIEVLEKDLLMVQKELRDVYEENAREYTKLNSLNKEDEEANRTSFVLLGMLVLFVISILTYPFMVHLGISSILAFIYLLGFNLINGIVSFGVVKMIHKYYQKFRLEHSLIIERQFDLVMESNRKREDIQKKYESVFAKKKKLMNIIFEEEKSIQEIKSSIVAILVHMYEERNQSLLAMLDQMIEIDIERQCKESTLDYENRL